MSNSDDLWDPSATDGDRSAARSRPGGNRLIFGCLIGGGLIVALVFGALVVLGLLYESGRFPPTEVRTGEETSERHLDRVREIGALDADEKVLLFYSWGVFDAAEGGTALTERGVVTWFEEFENEYFVERVPYAAVQDVYIDTPGSFTVDTTVMIESPLYMYTAFVSNEGGGDEHFVDRFLEEWNARGGHRPADIPRWYRTAMVEVVPRATPGDARTLRTLRGIGAIDEDEEVLLLFTWDPDDVAFDGCAVTDQGIASWYWEAVEPNDELEQVVERTPYAAIVGFERGERGSMFDLTGIDARTADGVHTIWVPRIHDDDLNMLSRARTEWRERGGSRPDEIPD